MLAIAHHVKERGLACGQSGSTRERLRDKQKSRLNSLVATWVKVQANSNGLINWAAVPTPAISKTN